MITTAIAIILPTHIAFLIFGTLEIVNKISIVLINKRQNSKKDYTYSE